MSLLSFFNSSLGRKYVMAITGFIWVGFVFGHMVGNLQLWLDPYWINAYAHKLVNLPYGLLWIIRGVLLAALVIHVWMAILLVRENRAARPSRYKAEDTVQASWASRYMILSGLVILVFFVFHIAHFTVRVIPGQEFNEEIAFPSGYVMPAKVPLISPDGEVYKDKAGEILMVKNCYNMMVAGFQYWWVSALYIIGTFLLLMHLSHGVSSMFQSLGLRNKAWRKRLDFIALAYGIVVFVGFATLPIAVMAGIIKPIEISVVDLHSLTGR